MKKSFKSLFAILAISALIATPAFACTPGQPGCVSATDLSNTTAYNLKESGYGFAEGSATTVRGAEANTGKLGLGKATTFVGGTSLDNVTTFSGGSGYGSGISGSYGAATSVAAGAEAATATRLIGNTSTHTFVNVSGDARQYNGTMAQSGGTTFAQGGNFSQADFSSNKSDYGHSIFIGSAAATINAGEATAIGGTLMTANSTPKSASSFGITGGSSQAGPNGNVSGNGSMTTQAVVDAPSGGFTYTTGSYCYNGPNAGSGFTAGGGAVNVMNTPNSSTVISISGQISHSTGGNLAPILQK